MIIIILKINNYRIYTNIYPSNSPLKMYLFKKKRTPLLTKRDELYKTIISKLPIQNRIDYCESLICRIQLDLLKSECRIQKRKFKKILKAAKTEINNLKKL
ncbi:hypothetical protein D1818_20910 [Aquimarina sp. BL5]|nr:hypothetical protein D1818_20910 [Aquimarina sp. BL5]RKN04833.1 hypothetical protein D7036_11680 [Aquimarina sp. BL5]